MAKLIIFFKILRSYFQNSFFPIFFLMFSVLSSKMDHKKTIENQTPKPQNPKTP